MAFGIPSSKELTDAGVALEDHAAVQANALIEHAAEEAHAVLDRLNGAKLMLIDGGFQLSIPESKPK